jgi:NAD-dependent dihydropyrimidine dehydrogenase PreA subunit
VRAVLDWLVAYLFRWLPRSAPTGLFRIGDPDQRSAVIVTGNFSLTIGRVRRALRGQNLWLLVANSDGINVWCAADGGIFTENRVIDAIKVSEIASRVEHRQVILPALSASGVAPEKIREETGFRARFGPVYARDIPAYLEGHKKKTEAMRRFDFVPRHRLDMFLPMNFPIYLLVAIPLAIFWPEYLLGYTILFWSAVASLYLFMDVIPGKTGWGQAISSATLLVLAWAGVDWLLRGDPLAHWGWFLAAYGVFFAAGFDLAGTASPRRSDAELMMQRLGFKSFGTLFSEKELGGIELDRERCRGCRSCFDICPVGVYGERDENKKTAFRDQQACFACGACVKQCPEHALHLA